jgi:hypothetical protein
MTNLHFSFSSQRLMGIIILYHHLTQNISSYIIWQTFTLLLLSYMRYISYQNDKPSLFFFFTDIKGSPLSNITEAPKSHNLQQVWPSEIFINIFGLFKSLSILKEKKEKKRKKKEKKKKKREKKDLSSLVPYCFAFISKVRKRKGE